MAVRVLLPSLQHALEAKRQNILKVHINCAIVEIQQSQSYHKWLESRLQLLVKVEKRYCGIRKGLTRVIIFYHTTCIYFSGLSLKVDRIWRKSSVFYLTSRLIRGGYLLVNYQKSILYVATLLYPIAFLQLLGLATCNACLYDKLCRIHNSKYNKGSAVIYNYCMRPSKIKAK